MPSFHKKKKKKEGRSAQFKYIYFSHYDNIFHLKNKEKEKIEVKKDVLGCKDITYRI